MPSLSSIHEKKFLCQVETYLGTKEYARHGRCVRLIGIESSEYQILMSAPDEGVKTFIFELDFWTFFKHIGWTMRWMKVDRLMEVVEDLESGLNVERPWYIIDLSVVLRSAEYFYRTFSDTTPTYFQINFIKAIDITTFSGLTMRMEKRPIQRLSPKNLTLTKLSSVSNPKALPSCQNQYVFDAFHVGQGMCSLIHKDNMGILLDAGAGKPITRKLYLDKVSPIRNDLRALVTPLEEVMMVASHTDYDHWKLLAWDNKLLNKINVIIVPDRTNHLLFRDAKIINKCRSTGTITLTLNSSTTLTLLRAKPAHSDANGECLVSVFNRSGKKVLAPGDYVYERFKNDRTTAIKGLHHSSYEAVIVPHHGDYASGFSVVAAASPTSIAFFSAGTHQGYGHPTAHSKKAHRYAKFTNICHNTTPYIFNVRLL